MRVKVKAPAPITDDEIHVLQIQKHGAADVFTFFLVFDIYGSAPVITIWIGNKTTGGGQLCQPVPYIPDEWTSVDLTYDLAAIQITGMFGTQSCTPGVIPDGGLVPPPTTGPYDFSATIGSGYIRSGTALVLMDDVAVSLE
jgi:hypothetical protein